MTAKEYLGQAWVIECNITNDELEIAAMRSALHNRGQCSGSVGGRPTDNPIERAYCRVLDREQQLEDEIRQLVEIKEDISKTIHKVPNVTLRSILIRRYLNFEKWDHISDALGYDIDSKHIFKLHTRALREVKKIINNIV